MATLLSIPSGWGDQESVDRELVALAFLFFLQCGRLLSNAFSPSYPLSWCWEEKPHAQNMSHSLLMKQDLWKTGSLRANCFFLIYACDFNSTNSVTMPCVCYIMLRMQGDYEQSLRGSWSLWGERKPQQNAARWERRVSPQTDRRTGQAFLEALNLTLKSVQATQELKQSWDVREWVWTSV